MLIVGAGWGGIQYAVRMIQAGIPAQKIQIIDPAATSICPFSEQRDMYLGIDIPAVRRFSTGVLNRPKLPGVPGILDYRGEMFHTSCWAYDITGGSPKDPSLDKLNNKTVAIIGTRASSVQVVPQLTRWCKHLYVIQQTPAAVDIRDQRGTDERWFKEEVDRCEGWQRERMKNFNEHFTLGDPPSLNLVDDQWTRAPSLVGIAGNSNGPKLPSEIVAYTSKLIKIDTPRQNRIRAQVDKQVKGPVTAEKLKPWYPSFCKRPLFHDDYLATFNKDNVVGNEEYKADIIICATGYRSPSTETHAGKANLAMIGKNGVSMSTEWPRQSGLGGNYAFTLGEYAKHAAYILSEAKRQANGKPFAVAPTAEAAENWAQLVLMNSAAMAVIVGCTLGYYNLEGELALLPVEYQAIAAWSTLWGTGMEDWLDVIEKWRAVGRMDGIEVRI
ncbi:hypothetical protein N7481_008681 [Penicillium waksmanii]|uniref:uncharacterized protein n=1 Tax=Penicillium waksmanii TaxID=69791 RepID=UPI002548C364|nr:uncharacterized protein N7481_008681 [Penicillium waksmanii]KAJ5974974.1 hypothetical protein N7481_008681 [Penicillium waksmanii]